MPLATLKDLVTNVFRRNQKEVYAPDWDNVSIEDSEFSDEQTGIKIHRGKCWCLQDIFQRYVTGKFVFAFTIVIAALVSIILMSTSSSNDEKKDGSAIPRPSPTPAPSRLSLSPNKGGDLGDLDLSNILKTPTRRPTLEDLPPHQDPRTQAILEKIQVLSGELIHLPHTPQHFAAVWIIHDDTLQLDASSPFLIQRYVMAVIYYGFHGYYSWHEGHDWMVAGSQECSWTGIKCNGNNFVTKIELQSIGLTGNLPKEIAGLSHLKHLNMSDNHIYGAIPNDFGVMNQLEYLYLERNDITGNVEKSVCDLREKGTLQIFTTDCDEITLKIKCDCCTNCESADNLLPLPDGDPNADSESESRKNGIATVLSVISGQHIHDVGSPRQRAFQWIVDDDNLKLDQYHKHLTQRYVIALMYFQLSGNMWKTKGWLSPDTNECSFFGITCNRDGDISVIKLDHQNLMGPLPGEIGALSSLRSINLNENGIEGIIPTEWAKLTKVEHIRLHSNMIGGEIPPKLCDLRSGKLSDFIVDCDLVSCSCCTNCLHGPHDDLDKSPIGSVPPTHSPAVHQPQSVKPATNMTPILSPAQPPTNALSCIKWAPPDLPNEYRSNELSMENERSEEISTYLKRATNFKKDSNCWSREIAIHWISNIDGQKLDVDNPRLIQRYILAVFYFSLKGYDWTIKPWLSGALNECEWKGIKCTPKGEVQSMVLNSGNLNGSLPHELELLYQLRVLDLNDNHISGNIPGEFQYLTNLLILKLQSNELVGQVSNGICMLKEMGSLSEIWVDCNQNNQYYVECQSLCCDKCGKDAYPAGHPPIFVFTGAPTMKPTEFNPFHVKKCPPKTGNMTMTLSIAEKLKQVSKSNQEELFILEENMTDTLISARGKALNWIIHDDGLGLEDCQDNLEQRYIAALLYFSLGGINWTHKNSGWLSESSFECEWNGIACDKTGRIIGISLKEFGLDGTIPYEVASLSSLEALDMSNNLIKGRIPNQFENLANLGILILYNNHITGSVPDTICSLKGQGSLHTLWVDCDESSNFQVTCNCCTRCSDVSN